MSAQRQALIALVFGACCIGLAPIFSKLAFDAEQPLPAAVGKAAVVETAIFSKLASSTLNCCRCRAADCA